MGERGVRSWFRQLAEQIVSHKPTDSPMLIIINDADSINTGRDAFPIIREEIEKLGLKVISEYRCRFKEHMIKHRKSGFFRIAAAILMICFTLFGLTACAGTTDSKDNNDDNALIQGTWEIDTGSGAGYKFVDDKFMWLKSIENVNDNYWYGDVEYYNGAEAMEIAGLTEEELKSSLPGLKPENIFVTKLDPEKIITDGEDKTATNMNDQTLWTRLWLIEENEDNVVAVVFDLETFSMESYTKVK